MVKKSKTDKKEFSEKQIEDIAKKIDFPTPDRKIKVHNTGAGVLITSDGEIYSLEWDFLRGHHYLLQLSHENSVRIPKPA